MSKPQKVTITLEDDGTNTSAEVQFDPAVSPNAESTDSFVVYAGLEVAQFIRDLMDKHLEAVEVTQ